MWMYTLCTTRDNGCSITCLRNPTAIFGVKCSPIVSTSLSPSFSDRPFPLVSSPRSFVSIGSIIGQQYALQICFLFYFYFYPGHGSCPKATGGVLYTIFPHIPTPDRYHLQQPTSYHTVLAGLPLPLLLPPIFTGSVGEPRPTNWRYNMLIHRPCLG